jgi:type IV pilus assembly protein PilY1
MPELHIMTNTKSSVAALFLLFAGLVPAQAPAQTYTENFTGTSTTNSWYFINGACLTMGTTATSTAANPACSGLAYYNNSPLPQFGGDTGTLPDTTTGALRFTDWYTQTGAILSNFNFQLTGPSATGLQVSFTTVTYEGDSGGAGRDGADGMSFFLQDATYPPDVGAFGGSLAYTCSNVNNSQTLRTNGVPRGYDGLIGGYIGLGIDEYGNFLNQGDNTSTGWGYQPGRIGMRGPGSTTIAWLSTNYPLYYPATLTTAQGAAAAQQACQTGRVWNWSNPAAPVETAIPLTNYAAIPGAYSVLPATRQIANETATTRAQAIPITYNLKITPTGLLSLSYTYNGGALQNVITAQDITAGGTIPIPANVRFGFAGSTGGSRNIHEIMCFQATPANTSQSSAGLNQKQTAKVQTGTQAYVAYYNPTTLAGSVTSQYIGQPVGDTNNNDLIISSTINWDGSCVLTGLAAGQTCDLTGPAGPITAQGSASRAILSWNGSTGIPFEWANLTAAQQAALDSGDATAAAATPPGAPPQNYSRLNYLRGDRSNEQTATSSTTFVGTFRARASVLGDIIDSSPTWVGPPNATFPNTWTDKYNTTGDPMAENAGETYATYASSTGFQNRTNVVYVGANDGLLHGFRSGYFSNPTTYQGATNDGTEVLAYMPGYIVSTIQTATGTPPTYVSRSNYSDPQYGHHFDVDAAPGTGDLFYAGQWHTWLVGGLGPGGNAIYALDVTDPTQFSETHAASLVIGEWSTIIGGTVTTPVVSSTNLSCANDSGPTNPCGNHLGKTYGVPEIRRFHNGSWGAVFGNGGGSVGGDAGIYVMLVNPTTGPASGGITFYYLSTSTGSQSSPNGIYFVASADLDGDHISDYVYAGDLHGNIWRFDLTSTNPANWGVTNNAGNSIVTGGGSATPLFTTPNGQPITSQVIVAGIATSTGNPRILVEFGTGQETPMNNGAAAQFLTSQQALYGIWDWNINTWNTKAVVKYDSLPGGGFSQPSTPLSGTTNLQQQTITGTYTATVANTGSDYRTVSAAPICWADTTGCTQYGWYLNLVSGNAYAPDPAVPQNGNAAYANTPVVWEQVIYTPVLALGTLVINTTIPPATAATMCFSSAVSGWTMAINPATGGALPSSFFEDPTTHSPINVTTTNTSNGVTTTSSSAISGTAFGASGSMSFLQAQGGQEYGLLQGPNGGVLPPVNPQGNLIGNRVTWIQKR